MEDYRAMIRSTFDLGSVRDAETLFETCIKNAFPTFNFRRLELIRFIREDQYMEGRSWNHVFEIKKSSLNGNPVWEVHCHRVTMGKTPDKHVYLDYFSLGKLLKDHMAELLNDIPTELTENFQHGLDHHVVVKQAERCNFRQFLTYSHFAHGAVANEKQ